MNRTSPNTTLRCIVLFAVSVVCVALIVRDPAQYWWTAPIGAACFSIMAYLLCLSAFQGMDKNLTDEEIQRERHAHWMDKHEAKSGSRRNDKHRHR